MGLAGLVLIVGLSGCDAAPEDRTASAASQTVAGAAPAGADVQKTEPEGLADRSRVEQVTLPRTTTITRRLAVSQVEAAALAYSTYEGEQVSGGLMVTLPEAVLFDFDQATLRAAGGDVLADVAALAAQYPGAALQVAGHTDSLGAPAYNRALSERRAQAVADALVDLEVDPGRLLVAGYGETRPVAPNTTPQGADDPAGRQANRRGGGDRPHRPAPTRRWGDRMTLRASIVGRRPSLGRGVRGC